MVAIKQLINARSSTQHADEFGPSKTGPARLRFRVLVLLKRAQIIIRADHCVGHFLCHKYADKRWNDVAALPLETADRSHIVYTQVRSCFANVGEL